CFMTDNEGNRNAFRIKTLPDHGGRPALFAPNTEDIGNTAASPLTNVDEVEHLDKHSVPRIGDSAADGGLNIHAAPAGIGKREALWCFLNDDSLPAVIIRIDQAVGQSFPQCLMDWSVIHAASIFHLEWGSNIQRKPVVDAEVKIIEIPAPVAGRRYE